jgi:hypothetical protein
MKYVPYTKLKGVPNVIVDGAASEDTVLTLSHWPGSGSPIAFRADTSTEIVLNYLETPDAKKKYAPGVKAVSNNHFDEDGLCAVWAMLHPKKAKNMRRLLVDVATAGDFAVYRRPKAAKVVFAIRSYADPETSPVADQLDDDDGSGSSRYAAILPVLEELLDDIDLFGPWWVDEWDVMLQSKTALVMGEVDLWEVPHVDLAVARTPEPLHPMVLYNNTERMRVLTVLPDGRYSLRYRYETWVQYASRPVMPRVDLAPLLPYLQEREGEPVQWAFDGNSSPTPVLQTLDADGASGPSSWRPDKLIDTLVAFLENNQDNPDLHWDPYK